MPLSRKKVEKALKTKGFVVDESKDHRFYYFTSKKTIFTKISTGTKYKTLGDDLIGKIHRQIRLSKNEFLEYVNCSMSLNAYCEKLKNQDLY